MMEVARSYGISRSTVSDYVRQYRNGELWASASTNPAPSAAHRPSQLAMTSGSASSVIGANDLLN